MRNNKYDCHYIFLCLSETADEYLFIGPYLLELPDASGYLKSYYNQLPILNNENLLLTLTNGLAEELWGADSDFSMEYIDYMIPDQHKPVVAPFSATENSDNEIDLFTLEQGYAQEKLLMDAVSAGKLHLITSVPESSPRGPMKNRLADSLRDRKNYLVILKTLLRKAAEYGGVHPLHIDKLSSKYADDIENLRTINQSILLQEDMIRNYCILVKQHSLKKYSYYVSRTITLVQYDLTADLKLKTIAQKLNVNASYLSDLFHREYGMTLTEFITKERIDHGIYLIQTTNKTIQEIATECGIPDTSYFIKLFKKQTDMTPNQYKQTTKSH